MKRFKTLDDILKFQDDLEYMEDRVVDIGIAIKFIDETWGYESYEIDGEKLCIVAYDKYYDLHDTRSIIVPLSYLIDDNFLEDYEAKEEQERLETEKRKREYDEEMKRISEDIERKQYERLRDKFESKEV